MTHNAGVTIIIITIVLFALGATPAAAASDKCRVVEAEGNRLVLECDREVADFGVGDQVKIKSVKKDGALEGC